ncbi:MAG: ligase-associated DNA damage response exonuclease [Opitutae bacterium]
MEEPLVVRPEGLYCPAGNFYIDPRGQVERALITHAHSDHARSGHKSYLVSQACLPLLKLRLGEEIIAEGICYGETRKIGDALVSFHPAGHILGSAQIRVEVKGRVWVVSGDYKPQHDRSCEPFGLVKCNVFVSECTFGLPVYQWEKEETVHQQINQWWSDNARAGKPSLLFAYSLGKAQRVLRGLDSSIGPIYAHGAVHPFLPVYQSSGVKFPKVQKVKEGHGNWAGAMIVAPPAVEDAGWTRRFKGAERGFASGWMAVRGARKRRNLDRGFVLSDHADWAGLLEVIKGTGAEQIKLTHGDGDPLARYLCEQGIQASMLQGAYHRTEEE